MRYASSLGCPRRPIAHTLGHGATPDEADGGPVVHCPSCGERYVAAAASREIERIRRHWRKVAVAMRVPVVKA